MSSGGLKKPLYQLVKFDSRNAQDIGNKIGGKVGDFIENEGKLNTQNPGRGVTKGLEALASWYLGGAAAGALGGAGGAGADAAANAATPAAEAAFQGMSTATTDQLMQQAIAQQAAQQAAQVSVPSALSSVPSPAINAMESTPQIAGKGLLSGPSVTDSMQVLKNRLAGPFGSPLGPSGIPTAPGVSPGQVALDSAKLMHQAGVTSNTQYAMDALKAKLMSAGAGLNTPKGQFLTQTGMGLLQPQQQPQFPQSPPPRQGVVQRVPSPYDMQGPNPMMQTPLQQIPPGMTLQQLQELLRRQQMGGYQ